MSEIKLPSEVIDKIKEKTANANTSEQLFNKFGMLWGATIAATHYEQENKRVVELLKDSLISKWYAMSSRKREEFYDNKFDNYWLQYCKDNGIKGRNDYEEHTDNKHR